MLMDHTARNMSCVLQLTATNAVVPSHGVLCLFIESQNGMSVNIKHSCPVFALVALSENLQ